MAALVLVGVAGVALGYSAGSKPPTSRPASAVTTAPSAPAVTSASPSAPVETTLPPLTTPAGFRLDGLWYHHSFTMDIAPGGWGTFEWRTNSFCDEGRRPCDISAGNDIVNGGWARFRLLSTGASEATGEVVATTDHRSVPLGRFTLRMDAAHDIVNVSLPPPGDRLAFCGDQAAQPNDCGA
ncbi:MAG TPA: hypothetical protein VFJ85_07155 [Acidimicrobiales bacterium]|nr:hypothetical protein [Acidimicrobiales bacterium]